MLSPVVVTLSPGADQVKEKTEVKDTEAQEPVSEVSRTNVDILPEGKEGWRNVKTATLLSTLGLLAARSISRYNDGVVRTLERRFQLSSVLSSLLPTIMDIMQSLTAGIVSYIGIKTNKMRVLAFTMVLTTAGLFINTVPYFIYGPKVILAPTVHHEAINRSFTELIKDGSLCVVQDIEADKCPQGSESVGNDDMAYIILVAGSIVGAFSSSPFLYLGVSYIEENASPGDAAVYLGFLMSMLAGSKILGPLLASFTLSLPESLQDEGIASDDPQFIGAWWLGYIILGAACVLILIPMMFLPSHTQYYYNNVKAKKSKEHSSTFTMVFTHTKDFLRAMVRVLSNKEFLLVSSCQMLGLYVTIGVIIQLPRYIEIHYHQPPNIASLITATTAAVSGLVGVMAGGLVLRWRGGSQRLYMTMVLIGVMAGLLSVLLAIFLSCPMTEMFEEEQGLTNRNQTGSCSSGCGCPLDDLQPVCGMDGIMFISPCRAGCSSLNTVNETYSDCSCLMSAGDQLSSSFCPQHSECWTFIPFCILIIVASFLAAMAMVPMNFLIMSVVEPDDKALALAFKSLFVNFGAFAPGSVLFGWLIDLSCRVWRETCGKTGSCMIYYTDLFRFYTYGVTDLFMLAAVICALLLYYSLSRKNFGEKEVIKD